MAASDLIRVNLEADGFRVRVVHDGFAALTEAWKETLTP